MKRTKDRLQFQNTQVLNREQLKNIVGGGSHITLAGARCAEACQANTDCIDPKCPICDTPNPTFPKICASSIG